MGSEFQKVLIPLAILYLPTTQVDSKFTLSRKNIPPAYAQKDSYT